MKITFPENSAYDICLEKDSVKVYIDLYIIEAFAKNNKLVWGIDAKDILKEYDEKTKI